MSDTVTSWRDSVSASAQEDLDRLLGDAVGFAQQELARRGGFFPFAAVVRFDGRAELVAARDVAEHPDAAAVLAACRAALAGERDGIRASAVVSDVSTSEGGNAIRVDLEHAEGPALTVLLPYSRRHGADAVVYGEIRAEQGARRIWA